MGRFTIRRGLTLAAALLAGGALALPFASSASSSAPTTSGSSPTTGTTSTEPTGSTETTNTGTGTTSTTPTTGTTQTTPGTTTSTTPKPTSPPPHIAGGWVERVATTSAVIKVGVNPEGLATTYRIQYGPTSAYGWQTGAAAAGSGNTEVKLALTVVGLAPNTTYHFRVTASNSAGATIGSDATFTTSKVAPTLTASVAPGPVAFGQPLMLSGSASGPESAGAQVVVQENPYPYDRGFENVTTPQTVDSAGNFSFVLPGLFESAQLRIATAGKPLAYTAPVGELVTVRVTLHARRTRRHGYVRLYGTVTPSEPGAKVAFERWKHGGYVAVSGTTVKGKAGADSHFGRIVPVHRGERIRALVRLPAGPLASGRSATVTVR